MKQRDKIRELYKQLHGEKEKIVNAYAKAELCAKVQRKSNAHNLSPTDYAGRLFADGLRKGWIRSCKIMTQKVRNS